MKKYAFIAIVALLSLSVTSTVAFADNDNDQVNQLKNILQQLQEKINGLTPSGIIKKIEKMEEKAFKLLPSGFPERIKIGKSGMNIEELGNGQIKVNLKNAVVTEIDLVNNVLTIKIFGLTGKIKITTDTKTQREYRGQSNINEFAVGDYVNAYGTQDPNNPTTINAEIVRNVSITKKNIEKRVCIQVITNALNPETNVCKTFPTPCAVPKGWNACPTTTATSTTATTTTQ
ncbi:MAG: hypothetical protein AAB757_03075 [Patescibacteria group bacterium]